MKVWCNFPFPVFTSLDPDPHIFAKLLIQNDLFWIWIQFQRFPKFRMHFLIDLGYLNLLIIHNLIFINNNDLLNMCYSYLTH